MTPNVNPRWYVAQTHVHAEAKAAAHLVRQGYCVYLPRYLKRRSHARRVETVASPLFPRYLFVAVDPSTQRWRTIESTIGVAQILCNGDEPAVAPAEVIAELKAREDDHGFIHLDRRLEFSRGDKVRVAYGVFAENLGLFEGMSDHQRATILLDLLGRKVRVVLDVESVAAA